MYLKQKYRNYRLSKTALSSDPVSLITFEDIPFALAAGNVCSDALFWMSESAAAFREEATFFRPAAPPVNRIESFKRTEFRERK